MFELSDKKPLTKRENNYFRLSFEKGEDDFMDIDYLVRYVKKIEAMVRTNPRYKNYINFLKTEVHLDRCVVLGNITDQDADIEMHHGPIYTLFDIVFIVMNSKLKNGEKVTTFRLTDEVLKLHEQHMVCAVMMCESVHQQDHQNEQFVNIKSAWGRDSLIDFLKKYKKGLTQEHKDKFMEYLKLYQKYESNSEDMYKINDKLKKWVKENGSDGEYLFYQ